MLSVLAFVCLPKTVLKNTKLCHCYRLCPAMSANTSKLALFYMCKLPVTQLLLLSVTFIPYSLMKVRKTARIRNRYNQVPYLTQDTKWESKKITINITNESQEVSRLPSGDHKAAINRRESMTHARHK